jgi:hypothetical protein
MPLDDPCRGAATRALAYGHVAAALGTLRRIGLEQILPRRPDLTPVNIALKKRGVALIRTFQVNSGHSSNTARVLRAQCTGGRN